MLLVSGGAPLRAGNRPWVLVEETKIKEMKASYNAATQVAGVLIEQVSTPAGIIMVLAAILAYGYLLYATLHMDTVARHRMGVALILFFFCMLFFAFFEQAGSSTRRGQTRD